MYVIHCFLIGYNAPCSPPCPPQKKNLRNHCFQFLLGITVVPREIENNGYIKFWGLNRVNYGLCEIVNCIVCCSVMLNYVKKLKENMYQ